MDRLDLVAADFCCRRHHWPNLDSGHLRRLLVIGSFGIAFQTYDAVSVHRILAGDTHPGDWSLASDPAASPSPL